MNQFTETTRSTINTIKAHALIAKALSNDPKPTPGYLFPEIARLTQSPATSSVVLSQLLKIITPSGSLASSNSQSFVVGNSSSSNSINTGAGAAGPSGTSLTYASSPHVLLKALKILRQLAQSGSVEFRTNLARRGKGPLAEMVGYRGQWDDTHGDRFNQDVRSVAEDLIEYMHSNPVQELDEPEELESFTEKEVAVLKQSTQDLRGFGNPEYDDSDSDHDHASQKRVSRSKKAVMERAPPPLPGFGNPAFEMDDVNKEPTLMTRLVDRLQDMAAPPPPIAMRAAYRQQEQRRQKLFVGEYSMREDGSNTHGRTRDGAITLMGTNPFKRTTRIQGMVAGGWGEKKAVAENSGDISFGGNHTTSRVFPVARVTGTRGVRFRNATAESVYGLAQHIQTSLVRSKLLSSLRTKDNGSLARDLLGTEVPKIPQEGTSEDDGLLLFWGTAKEICDVVAEGLRRERVESSVEHLDESVPSSAGQSVSMMTGLVRDMTDWIEREDWERRLRHLFVLDALLAHPEIESDLLSCSALPRLSETLTGPLCEGAPQRSVQVLSAHLAGYIKRVYSKASRPRTPSGLTSGKGSLASEAALPNMMLLDIGA